MGSTHPHLPTSISWILASASPRRQALLRQLGLSFTCIPSRIEERAHEREAPRHFAQRMAEEKALDIARDIAHQTSSIALSDESASAQNNAQNRGETWVIGGDTVVALKEKILGKPIDVQDAEDMLTQLSNREHDVWSGWAIARQTSTGPEVIKSGVSQGVVTMRALSIEEIGSYVATGEPLDKAGSYGIQGLGGRFVDKLTGSLYGVIGLPLLDLGEAISGLKQLPHSEFALRGVALRERAATAAWRSGRSVDEVQVLAVSKKNSAQKVLTAGAHHFSHFGESYLQELTGKRPEVELSWPTSYGADPTWHYIGGIQRNKARHIGAQAQWIHGVSRFVEAQRINEGASNVGGCPQILIQVNIAGETSKGGAQPHDVLELLTQCATLNSIKVVGLMTFPPLSAPEDNRVHFRALRALRDQLTQSGFQLPHLSMGTSHDFEVAIEEGATWVRLGRSLFGERT